MSSVSTNAQDVQCTLCGLPTRYPLINDAGDYFCCPACLEVSQLLAEAPKKVAVGDTAVSPEAQIEKTTISLSGLWCPSCAWLINERLERAQGVQAAEVNFIQREALITYDAGQTSPNRLVRQVKKIGYGAKLSGEERANEEETAWNLLLISGVLVMHIMVFSFMLYFREWTGRATLETEWLADIFRLMIAAMSVPVIAIIGLPILRAGAASLLRGRPNTHTLIAIGSFAAFGLSLRNLWRGQGDVYFDTAAILLFLMSVGHWLELRAQKVSSEAVEQLWQQIPAEATWLTANGWQTGSVAEIPVGARVRVRPGERFPVDGVIAKGQGDVDESVVTGEPDPVLHQPGEQALAGTINLDGSFELIATAIGADTVIGQIGHLLHQALWQRAPSEQMADKLAARLVPLAVTLAVLTFAFWTWQDGVDMGLTHALAVLLIACPCALGIATPLTLWIGLGRAAQAGVIVRYTAVLERLAAIEQICFDKTGTLTQRPIRLQAVVTDGLPQADFLTRVAAIEALSEHPLGQAIVNGAQQQGIAAAAEVSQFSVLPGQGVTAVWSGDQVWIGNRGLMAEQGLVLPDGSRETAVNWQADGSLVVYVGWNGRVRGLICLGERMRADAVSSIAHLQQMGIPATILTGDDAAAGERWQQTLNVPVYAEQRPEDKVAYLQNAKVVAPVGVVELVETTGLRQAQAASPKNNIAMVGDGINDGPALAAATVGIAMRQGTDVAQSAADVILLHDALDTVPWLIALSQTAMRKVRHNLIWAVGYNSVGLLLAMTGYLQPSLAALLMVLSNLIVTTNALHLRRMRLGLWEERPLAEHPPDEDTTLQTISTSKLEISSYG